MLKRITLFTAALCSFYILSYGQTEKESPFTFEGSYVGDTYYNAAGGRQIGGGFMGMGNIRVGFDTEKAHLWKGGSLFINGASIHGKSLSENYLGDLQVASNIDAGNHIYMHELWFRQEIGKLSFTVGLQDLNAEFIVSENAGEFTNSSFGVPSVISVGVPVPIFPLTGLGIAAKFDINGRWTAQAALFDGNQTSFDHNPHNVNWSLSNADGLLTLGEVHLDNHYKLGAYYHSADKNYGFYAIADQSISERLNVFGQLAFAPKHKNENNFSLGFGINASGIFSKQEHDAAGLAVTHAGLHNADHKHETAIEFYYKYKLNDLITLQPDIQYIINPSGADKKLPNALFGMIRLHIKF